MSGIEQRIPRLAEAEVDTAMALPNRPQANLAAAADRHCFLDALLCPARARGEIHAAAV